MSIADEFKVFEDIEYCLDRSYFESNTCKSPFQDSCCQFGVDTGFPGVDFECVSCSNDQCGTNNSCADGLLYKFNVSQCCNTLGKRYGGLPCHS